MNEFVNSPLIKIFKTLFEPYRERVSEVSKVSQAMVSNGMIANENEIVNDHIAFRTLGVPHLGITSFEKIFLHYGYQKRDHYYFEGKKLDAYWYAPPSPSYPRIFISELRVRDLSQEAQDIIENYTGHISTDPAENLNMNCPDEVGAFFHKPLWQLPTLEDYNALAAESEYAAWTIYNRYYLNHYTISVHELPLPYNTIESFNAFMESIGIKLNTAGGKIKVSKDGLLKQSSTVAQLVEADFANNERAKIAGSYVEFAERLPLPAFAGQGLKTYDREMRREGFESANADKIFESTYNEQTKKTEE